MEARLLENRKPEDDLFYCSRWVWWWHRYRYGLQSSGWYGFQPIRESGMSGDRTDASYAEPIGGGTDEYVFKSRIIVRWRIKLEWISVTLFLTFDCLELKKGDRVRIYTCKGEDHEEIGPRTGKGYEVVYWNFDAAVWKEHGSEVKLMKDGDSKTVFWLINKIKFTLKWLFTTVSHFAAENIAFMYSLLESCKLNNVNFGEYVEDILPDWWRVRKVTCLSFQIRMFLVQKKNWIKLPDRAKYEIKQNF